MSFARMGWYRVFHLVFLRQVQPELRHLKHAAGLLEIRGVELLVDDTTRRGHPLHVARADDVAISDRIAVLDLPCHAIVMVSNPAIGSDLFSRSSA